MTGSAYGTGASLTTPMNRCLARDCREVALPVPSVARLGRCADPSGSSSVGRAPPSQGGCRGFESRLPLHSLLALLGSSLSFVAPGGGNGQVRARQRLKLLLRGRPLHPLTDTATKALVGASCLAVAPPDERTAVHLCRRSGAPAGCIQERLGYFAGNEAELLGTAGRIDAQDQVRHASAMERRRLLERSATSLGGGGHVHLANEHQRILRSTRRLERAPQLVPLLREVAVVAGVDAGEEPAIADASRLPADRSDPGASRPVPQPPAPRRALAALRPPPRAGRSARAAAATRSPAPDAPPRASRRRSQVRSARRSRDRAPWRPWRAPPGGETCSIAHRGRPTTRGRGGPGSPPR
jgi:hypothetical protein